ncbi:MAG: extracellular solute-binding protein [Cohaesibacter sp.]|nr:extracellular solute-binding protein [Cohaesibacter sp.]
MKDRSQEMSFPASRLERSGRVLRDKDLSSGSSGLSRRSFLNSSAVALASGALLMGRPLVGWAADKRHGLSVFGPLKYGPDFAYFDYINPKAPKGGRFVFSAPSWAYNQNHATFNTLNGFVLKGDAPPRVEMLFDTLMVRALDEADAIYGLLAKTVSLSPDGNHYRFSLRSEARFHDGSPVRAQDVAFSYMLLKEKGHPIIRTSLRDLVSADVDGDEVVLRFSGRQGRQAPMEVASTVPIFSKAYYSAVDFEKSSLTPPLGSGPYKIGKFKAGSFIEYERDAAYWGKDLPVNIGQNNFDVIRLEFNRERTALFEAFKKGDITYHEEFSSKSWATRYSFPAIEDGRVKRLALPDRSPSGAQGWFFNLRRAKFADPRTREALALAFDFEWSNKNLFFGLYQRTHSFFERTNMKASGKASGKVLDLLEPYRDQLDPAIFDQPYTPPMSDGSGKDRRLLRKANQLLAQAGWKRDKDGLVNEAGERLEIEVMSNSSAFERVVTPWANNLALLGVNMTFRLVDPSQFQSRADSFDFDIVSRRYTLSLTLSDSIRNFWSSASADISGSYNIAGIKHPVLDAMIDKALNATNREDMEAAGQAIDRILRAGHYWVPNWNKPVHTIGVWDQYGWIDPDKTPDPVLWFSPERWWWKK